MHPAINNEVSIMSSREIAELVESRHEDVKRSIDRLVIKGVIQSPPMADFKNINNVAGKEYLICKRDSYVIVAQLSPEFTARLVDRWQELEVANQVALPSYPEALRQLASSIELSTKQQAIIEQQKPAVEFVERYVEARSSKCLSDVAKLLRHKPQAFFKLLSDNEVIFKRSGSWVPYQQHIDAGRFTVTTGESNGHAYQQTRVEPDGIVWLANNFPA